MLNRLLIVSLFAVLACIPEIAVAQAQGTGPGSFLKHKADSVTALISEISANPSTTARYARHFGISADEVRKYFKENLKLVTLSKPVSKTVYFINKKGSVSSSKRSLAAGTKVFATKNGELVLLWRCGNPLSRSLPAKPVMTKGTPKVTAPVVETTTAIVAPTVAETPTVQVASANPIEMGQIPPPASSILPVIEEAQASVVTSIEPAVAPVVAMPPLMNAGKALPLLIPLLLGGGSNSPHSEPVPEPSSIIVLCSTLATAGLAWRRQRCK